MRAFFIPCLVLLAFALLAGLVAGSSFKKLSDLHASVAAAQQSVDAFQMQKEVEQATLSRLRTELQPAEDFIKDWQDAFIGDDDVQRILSSLDSIAVASVVSSSDKQNVANPGYTFGSKIIPAKTVQISVSGDYYRLLNFLGAVEEQYPLARVESIMFTNTNGLKMTSTFSFPIYFKPITVAK